MSSPQNNNTGRGLQRDVFKLIATPSDNYSKLSFEVDFTSIKPLETESNFIVNNIVASGLVEKLSKESIKV